MRKLTHPPCENLFFQGTRRRRARHREGNRRPKTTAKVDATRPLEMPKHCDFPGSRGRPSKYVPKRPPGAPQRASGEPPGRPKRAPRGDTGAPRRPQEPPKGPQEPPTCGLRAALAATWGKPCAQKTPTCLQDAILAPSGLDFGPFGSRFWRPPKTRLGASRELWGIHFWDNVESIFDPSGAHRGFISGLPGLRSESSWSSRASQFWQDLAAKTPQHQARQGRPRPA